MLFNDNTYFDYNLPMPQYLGAKYSHLAWINKHIPNNIKTAFDAFSGSQSVAYLFKQRGLRTLTNDFLNFNNQIGLSLIENKKEYLNEEDIKILFQSSPQKKDFHLIEDIYTDLFFERKEAIFLDNFRANIPLLSNKYKQALAFTIINRSMTRKVTMGHFAHTQALVYAHNNDRIKRNKSLITPIKDIFLELLPKYNAAIFDNQQDNISYNQNILDILPYTKNVDLIYFDPPYCDSHADYQSFYHILETYTEYWSNKNFINGTKRYDPQLYSGFDKKNDVIKSLNKLFELSEDIPYWIISYNDRSYPKINDFYKIISKYRDVSIEKKEYLNGRGGKGSVKGSNEILFVAKPKNMCFIQKKEYEYERI